jgi:hypothetical protein
VAQVHTDLARLDWVFRDILRRDGLVDEDARRRRPASPIEGYQVHLRICRMAGADTARGKENAMSLTPERPVGEARTLVALSTGRTVDVRYRRGAVLGYERPQHLDAGAFQVRGRGRLALEGGMSQACHGFGREEQRSRD